MPKKTRKAKIRASQRPINVGYAPVLPGTAPVAPSPAPGPSTLEPNGGSVAPRSVATAPTPIRSAAPVTFDYGYVYRDLRRIGLLALTFFLIMFILWFVVEYQGIHLIPGVF